ncbi:hypothetical protein KCU99_g414, partial [Aureobasidium melanogenum]
MSEARAQGKDHGCLTRGIWIKYSDKQCNSKTNKKKYTKTKASRWVSRPQGAFQDSSLGMISGIKSRTGAGRTCMRVCV